MDIVYLKLVSGESILAYAENSDEEYVHTYKPIQLHVVNSMNGALIRTTKWIPFTKQEDFPIKVNNILIIASPTEDIEKYYLRSLDVLDEEDGDLLLDENLWERSFNEEYETEETLHAIQELVANTEIKVH